MTENEKISKIEESKKNLARAFSRLENIIENKIKSQDNSDLLQEINDLKLKLEENEKNNKTIIKDYEELVDKYNKTKVTTKEVAENITTSINFIEELLENENANS